MARRQRSREEYMNEMEKRASNTSTSTNKKKYMDYSGIEGGVEFFNPIAEHRHAIDIIPFVPTKGKFPEGTNGDDEYALSVWVHRSVGVNNETHLCTKKTYGKPCPICDYISDRFNDGTFADGQNEEYKAIKPSQRTIMNIVDLEDENKRKVFDYSNYYFNANLAKKIKNMPADEGFIDLYNIEEGGPTIKFTPDTSSFTPPGSKKVFPGEISDINFIPRSHSYTDDDVENAPKLDTCIFSLPYNDLQALFNGDGEEEGEEEIDNDNFKTSEADSIKENVAIAPNAFVAPPKTLSREERMKARKDKKEVEDGPVCPYGYVFGRDNYGEDMPNCDKCGETHKDIMEACSKKYDELNS